MNSEIATAPDLLALLERARGHKMTPAEYREQRISYVFGMLSSDDPRTKDDVRAWLDEHEDHRVAAPGADPTPHRNRAADIALALGLTPELLRPLMARLHAAGLWIGEGVGPHARMAEVHFDEGDNRKD